MSANSIHYNQINEYMSGHGNFDKLEPGMGATRFVGSDRYPYVVVDVPTPKHVRVFWIHDDDFEKMFDKRENGVMMMKPEYLEKVYAKGLDYFTSYTYRKNGRWMAKGDDMWATGAIQIGVADQYLDPCF